ncbi:hypothetical protein [Caulobacter sp. 602-1]|uniref:hypothetical protein n=1 Tax=Caulobacter sp. 602-1 TaxID=2492472 RepID=UPI000F6349B0|nr:hypothetical protein [Caulobacter sp. 602-1]RRN62371.1 hypothetical protein EIK80_21925 [Caulobacter sp. 602-1]
MLTPDTSKRSRAHWLARLWTWVVTIVLTFSAIGVAFGGGAMSCYWRGGREDQPLPPLPLFGSSIRLDAHLVMTVGLPVWLAAWALHLYASRRRRMGVAHAVVPALSFALWFVAGLRAAPVCHTL